MAAELISYLGNGERMLFIAPTREITVQFARNAARRGDCVVGVEMGGRHAPRSANVIVATAAAMYRRLDRWRHANFKYIVVDEGHHAAPDNYYEDILSVWGCGTARGEERVEKLIFLTATPRRSDGWGMGHFIDEVAFEYSIRWGVENGWLVRPIVEKVDYEDALTARVAVADALRRAPLPAIVFVSSVKEIHKVSDHLRSLDYVCSVAYGTQTAEERRKNISDFAEGRSDVMVAHMALTEGWDAPEAKSLIIERGTNSPVLYTQMVGRLLRPSIGHILGEYETVEERLAAIADSDKPIAYIFDISDEKIPGLVTFASLYDSGAKMADKKSEREKVQKEIDEKMPSVFELIAVEPDKIEKSSVIVNLLGDSVEDDDGIEWIRHGDALYTYADADPTDADGLPCVFIKRGGKAYIYNFGGYSRRIGRPRRSHLKRVDEKVFKKATNSVRLRSKRYIEALTGLRPRNDSETEWKRLFTAAKIMSAIWALEQRD